MKNKIIQVKVKRIRWLTDKRGNLHGILVLTKKLPDGNDSLSMPAEAVVQMQADTGTIIKMVQDAAGFQILNTFKKKEVHAPLSCPSCGSLVNNFKCDHNRCPANGLTPVRKLFRALTDLPAFADVYCSKFPVSFERVEVLEDFSDFLNYLKTLGGLGTTARHSIIEKHLSSELKAWDRSAQDLVKWENEFLYQLSVSKAGTLIVAPALFWDLFFIPELSDEDRKTLADIDPLHLDFKNLPLSKSGNLQLLNNSADLFRFLDLIRK